MAKKGVKLSLEHRKKIGLANMGEKSSFWKGGVKTNNPNYYREKVKEYKSLHKEQYIIYNRNRRARLRNADGSFTLGEWELLKIQYGNKCPCCKKEEPRIKLTVDHIIPLYKGGTNYIENIQPLCKSCNSRKKLKIIRYVL